MSTAPNNNPSQGGGQGGTRMRLDTFDPRAGLDRGHGRGVELAW